MFTLITRLCSALRPFCTALGAFVLFLFGLACLYGIWALLMGEETSHPHNFTVTLPAHPNGGLESRIRLLAVLRQLGAEAEDSYPQSATISARFPDNADTITSIVSYVLPPGTTFTATCTSITTRHAQDRCYALYRAYTGAR
jgi:hypothetical protein